MNYKLIDYRASNLIFKILTFTLSFPRVIRKYSGRKIALPISANQENFFMRRNELYIKSFVEAT